MIRAAYQFLASLFLSKNELPAKLLQRDGNKCLWRLISRTTQHVKLWNFRASIAFVTMKPLSFAVIETTSFHCNHLYINTLCVCVNNTHLLWSVVGLDTIILALEVFLLGNAMFTQNLSKLGNGDTEYAKCTQHLLCWYRNSREVAGRHLTGRHWTPHVRHRR